MGNGPVYSPPRPFHDSSEERTFNRSSKGVPRVMSNESIAGRGRALLETFDKVRSDHATKYAGNDEEATVGFCQEVLNRGGYNKFTVIKTISCGTTSLVCLAQDEEEQEVAIKYARLGQDSTSKEFRDRKRQFEIEAKLQRRCTCENVPKLFDFKIIDLFAIFIMEYLPRTLLDDIVVSNRTGEFPELRAAQHVRGIALALKTCHSLSIAHLDVKLDNILISANGQAKLCDFGLADVVPIVRSAATPLYSPPEIIIYGQCNEKADMWSLGVCVFILLCGYPPFQPDDKHDLNDNICKARYSFRQEEGWDHVSALARDLVARLLVIDPGTRWSAKQVLEHPWIIAAGVALEKQQQVNNNNNNNNISKPPLLKRHESILNLEILQERKIFEEELKKKRSLSSFLQFAEQVKIGWKESGWRGATEVGKKDPNYGNMVAFAEDIGRGWKEGGLKGVINTAKSFTSTSGEICSSSSSSSVLINEEEEEEEERNFFLQREDRADSKLFLKSMYGSTSPLRPPVWVPDGEASVCRLCEVQFSFFRRRHHCRSCGQVICNDCSMRRRIVSRVDPKNLVRVCDLCSVSSRTQQVNIL